MAKFMIRVTSTAHNNLFKKSKSSFRVFKMNKLMLRRTGNSYHKFSHRYSSRNFLKNKISFISLRSDKK